MNTYGPVIVDTTSTAIVAAAATTHTLLNFINLSDGVLLASWDSGATWYCVPRHSNKQVKVAAVAETAIRVKALSTGQPVTCCVEFDVVCGAGNWTAA